MKKQLIYLLVVLMSTQFLVAQDSKLNLAQKKYNELAYPKAIKLYEELAKDGYKSKELFENLANAYYYKADFAPAKIKSPSFSRSSSSTTTTCFPSRIARIASSIESNRVIA